jgi:hypothetical protein
MLGVLSFSVVLLNLLSVFAFNAISIFGLGFDDYKFGPGGTFEIAVMIGSVLSIIVSILFIAIYTFLYWRKPNISKGKMVVLLCIATTPLALFYGIDLITRVNNGSPFSTKAHNEKINSQK